jgi:hypothetical protein
MALTGIVARDWTRETVPPDHQDGRVDVAVPAGYGLHPVLAMAS